jgi:hypothetical protein
MRSGTLMLILFANAAIACGVVFVAHIAFPAAPEPSSAATGSRANLDLADLNDKVADLEDRVRVQADTIHQLSQDLTASREEIASLRERGPVAAASPAGEVARAEPTEEEKAEEAAAKARQEMFKAMTQGWAAQSKRRMQQMLEGLANPNEESIRQAEERDRRDAQRVTRELGLSEDRASLATQALMDVGRQVRERMGAAVREKGVENVTYEDAKAQMDQLIVERERAMQPILSTQEMSTFQEREQRNQTMMDGFLRMSLPSGKGDSGSTGTTPR